MTDVATAAGVSIATASKALNGKDRVSAATRDRVLKAAEALSFAPNQVAQSLLSGRTRTVGLLIEDSGVERFAIPVMLGAENTLGSTELSIILCDGRGDDIRLRHYLKRLLAHQVDGLIIIGSSTDLTRPLLPHVDVPTVYVYGGSIDPADTSFMPDERRGAELTVEHLVASGRRRIAHITGPLEYTASTERAAGVQAALDRADLSLVADVGFGQWSQRWGRHATHVLLAQGVDFDAVVSGSDQIATGVADALIEAGRMIPSDVALTGFDNWLEFAEEARPPLTTVDMNLEQLGAAAAHHLLSLLAGEEVEPGVHRQPCRLIVRDSTAPVTGQR